VPLCDLGFLVPKQLAYGFQGRAAQKQTLGEGVPELVDVAVNTTCLNNRANALRRWWHNPQRLIPRPEGVIRLIDHSCGYVIGDRAVSFGEKLSPQDDAE
jgi:hypothetical protein